MSDSIIDTSKMSEGQRAALELAESSRDSRELSGFAASIFDGAPDFPAIFPFPAQSSEDKAEGDVFLEKLRTFLDKKTDPDAIDREGEKLWCTNSLKAFALIVMARTATPEKPHGTTAFIVEMDRPGVEIVTRCHFMGLKALYNGVVRFTGVKVPVENIVAAPGKGLKVALTTLNTGRLTLPAACVGLLDRCLEMALAWSSTRVQWGQEIGRHAAIAANLADLAADKFATEALVLYTSALVDADKNADIRMEASPAARRSFPKTRRLRMRRATGSRGA